MELYIHIPFCKSKCSYCDFASWPGYESQMADYTYALISEAKTFSSPEHPLSIETLFIGGGTPSLLPPKLLNALLSELERIFLFDKLTEFTSEANPGTLTEEWLQCAVSHGLNRLSMGMQAYQPELLHMLGRIHRYEDVIQSVSLSRRLGVNNLNLDLMFGLPGQSMTQWEETLQAAYELKPEHLSCYGLIPEEGTRLKQLLDDEQLFLPHEDIEREMYDLAVESNHKNGLIQYEISNFAKPGFACQHNLGYWHQSFYLGIGASAASMLPDHHFAYKRTTNPREIKDYLSMIRGSGVAREEQFITQEEARFETIMLGLRTNEGIDDTYFKKMHGVSMLDVYGDLLISLEKRQLINHQDHRWFLTRRGMDIQNSILLEFMPD